MTFTPIRAAACVLATAIALPLAVLASEGAPLTAELETKIREDLTAKGYEVRKIEEEDGLYEAYAIKDGKKLEIYMNADLEIMKVEED